MGAGSLKKDHETIGLRNVLERCQMVEFHDFPTFYVNFTFPISFFEKVVAELWKFQFFAPARPGCSEAC